MDITMTREAKFETVMRYTRIIYGLFGIGLALQGAFTGDMYKMPLAIGTLFIYPALWFIYRLFHWKPGYQLEFVIYAFTFLAYSLGGVAGVYTTVPGFDKVAHMLSGILVSMLAMAMYLYLERDRPLSEHSVPTAIFFIFFASMAVAGLFELCEWTVAPIVGRDLQHVTGSGVNDTMQDMLVCMIGTLAFLPFVARFYRGKYDLLTGAVAAFVAKNNLCNMQTEAF